MCMGDSCQGGRSNYTSHARKKVTVSFRISSRMNGQVSFAQMGNLCHRSKCRLAVSRCRSECSSDTSRLLALQMNFSCACLKGLNCPKSFLLRTLLHLILRSISLRMTCGTVRNTSCSSRFSRIFGFKLSIFGILEFQN